MKQRRPIPKQTVDLVLGGNTHTCCICHDCHSYIHADGGLCRRVSTSELHDLKTNWEDICKEMTPGEMAQRFRELMLNHDGSYKYCSKFGAEVTITDRKLSYIDYKTNELSVD